MVNVAAGGRSMAVRRLIGASLSGGCLTVAAVGFTHARASIAPLPGNRTN